MDLKRRFSWLQVSEVATWRQEAACNDKIQFRCSAQCMTKVVIAIGNVHRWWHNSSGLAAGSNLSTQSCNAVQHLRATTVYLKFYNEYKKGIMMLVHNLSSILIAT